MQRWDCAFERGMDDAEFGAFVYAEDALAEIRRLRAMVLRAHANRLDEWPACVDTAIPCGLFRHDYVFAKSWDSRVPESQNNNMEARAARLLRHWAQAIEEGRVP